VASVRDSAGVRIVESLAPAISGGVFAEIDSMPSVSIGAEDGDEVYQLHRVADAHRFADGRIAIGNSGTHDIRVFDAAGKHLLSVGRQGSGPGEYNELATIALHAHRDSILASDGGAYRMNVYTPEMSFVETRTFDVTGEFSRPFMQGVFDDGRWLVLGFEGGGTLSGPPGTVLDGMAFTLMRYDARGRREGNITQVVARPRYVNQVGQIIHYPFIPLTAEPLHALAADEVFVVRSGKPELEVFAATGELRRVVRWSQTQQRTADVWEDYKRRSLEGMSAVQRPRYEVLFGRELPLPEFVPAYSVLFTDARGRAWLARYRLGGETAPPTWDVIDTDGTWLGSVAMPRRFTPYRIGDDFVLGKHTDSLGVERVQVRSLRRK
jgi:hypothetical protein